MLKTPLSVHAFYIAAIIFAALQIGQQREALGYHDARFQECLKITASSNSEIDANMKQPLTFSERQAMYRRCDALAERAYRRQFVWFWNAPERDGEWVNERWHY